MNENKDVLNIEAKGLQFTAERDAEAYPNTGLVINRHSSVEFWNIKDSFGKYVTSVTMRKGDNPQNLISSWLRIHAV